MNTIGRWAICVKSLTFCIYIIWNTNSVSKSKYSKRFVSSSQVCKLDSELEANGISERLADLKIVSDLMPFSLWNFVEYAFVEIMAHTIQASEQNFNFPAVTIGELKQSDYDDLDLFYMASTIVLLSCVYFSTSKRRYIVLSICFLL